MISSNLSGAIEHPDKNEIPNVKSARFLILNFYYLKFCITLLLWGGET
jgi:hypothetical protein